MNTVLKKSQTHFLCEKLSYPKSNNPKILTTKSSTTIDAILTRYFHDVQSQNYISYFSNRKLIITIILIKQ